MKNTFATVIGFVSFITGCKPTQENATTASSTQYNQFAIVKRCVGELNSNWVDLSSNKPVKGELDMTVGTLPNSKAIKTITLRNLIPERRVVATNEILPRGLFEMKNISVASLKVWKSRGSLVTRVTPAPKQKVTLTSGSQKTSFDLVSLEFRNGDGADYVSLQFSMLDNTTGQNFSGDFLFDGCGLENMSLLRAYLK